MDKIIHNTIIDAHMTRNCNDQSREIFSSLNAPPTAY